MAGKSLIVKQFILKCQYNITDQNAHTHYTLCNNYIYKKYCLYIYIVQEIIYENTYQLYIIMQCIIKDKCIFNIYIINEYKRQMIITYIYKMLYFPSF